MYLMNEHSPSIRVFVKTIKAFWLTNTVTQACVRSSGSLRFDLAKIA